MALSAGVRITTSGLSDARDRAARRVRRLKFRRLPFRCYLRLSNTPPLPHPAAAMRPRLSPKRAAIVLVTAAAGLFLMPSLLSPLFAARSDPAYPRLSDNTAASARLEVRKLLHGHVDGLFAVPSTGQVIAAAGGTLWKFSADGLLLDTLDEPAHMHVSGIAFGPEGYVDWVFTGEHERRAYAPAVDGSGLSRKELEAELDRAQVVAFGSDDAHAWAWLWTEGRAWKLRIDPYREQVDTWCRQRSHSDDALGWHATCLEDYAPQAAALVEVEPESFSRSYGDLPPRLRVAGFDRRKYHLEEGVSGQLLHATVGTVLKGMGVPGGGPGRYWFGDAHVQLDVGGETVKFKAFVPRVDGDYEFLRNMRWWEPARAMPGASPWFSVHMRGYMEHPGERELLEYYRDDIGLYVVRPRGTGEAPAAQRQLPAWQPRFEGEPTRYDPVTATVEFADGRRVERWLRPPPPRLAIDTVPQVVVEPVQPDLYALPRAMTVTWGSPGDPEERADLRVDLDHPQVRELLSAPAAGPRELVLRGPDLYAPTSRMQVLLREAGREQPLSGARLEVLRRPAFRPYYQGTPSRHDQLRANVAAAAGGDDTALDEFLRQAAALAQDPERADDFAPAVTAAYAELVNASNVAGNTASSSRLVRHYLAQVHPHASAHTDPSVGYNIGVIASQTLAFAIRQPAERDLVEAVMTTLVGPNFDPAAQTNATLAYNLACLYALEGDTERMLQAVVAARRLGKPASQFIADADFQGYREDPQFRQALGEGG